MTLYEVKKVIFRTECENLLFDGLCCSEPIMTKDNKGIVDNYFVYGLDRDNKSYSGVIVKFGIYSDSITVAYIDKDIKSKVRKGENDYFPAQNWGCYDNIAYEKYVNTFSEVRDFVFEKTLNHEQKERLRTYIDSLKCIVDDSLWDIYISLNPLFYEWVNETLANRR